MFEVIDKSGRKIRLTKKQWNHICVEHPRIKDPEEIKRALVNPIEIRLHESSNDVCDYYTYFKNLKSDSKYLKVVVKYLNGDGFVITAYFVRRIN